MDEKNKGFDWKNFLSNLTDEDVEKYRKAKKQSEYNITNFIDDITKSENDNER